MSALSEILRTKLIPWSQQNASERFIIARPKMRQANMPSGVRLIPHKIQSKRVLIKNKRCYNNVRNIMAEWPDAGLHELGKYAMVCVLDGFVDYPLGNYKLQCGPGHFIFIPPGIPHPNGSQTYVDLQKSTSCDIITFLLHPHALEYWTSHAHSQGRTRNNDCLVPHNQAVSLFWMLVEEVNSDEMIDTQISEELLSVFLSVLQREINASRFQRIRLNNQSGLESLGSLQTDFVTRLEQYVQSNLRHSLTLENVSREMYLSTAQFTRNVRRETGKSFNQFLAEHRLAEAKNLLRNSEWTISAIAELVGFQSVSYFCTFFKEHINATPSEFRAQSQKKTLNLLN